MKKILMKKGVMKKILMKKLSLESERNKKVSEDQKQRILKYRKKYYIMQKTDFKQFMKCSYNLHNSCNLHNLYNLHNFYYSYYLHNSYYSFSKINFLKHIKYYKFFFSSIYTNEK